MNIKEIVKEYLKKNKYDGLFLNKICACKIDELMFCGECNEDCEAGNLVDCKKCKDYIDDKEDYCKFDHNYCIGKNVRKK